jgi:hypothetical protein
VLLEGRCRVYSTDERTQMSRRSGKCYLQAEH